MTQSLHTEILFLALFVIATAVAIGTRWLKIPYTVALVFTGLALGTTHAFEPPALTKELFYLIFLPGLLFEASFHLEFKRFWKNKLAIHSLAIPGLLASIALTSIFLTPLVQTFHLEKDFHFLYGLLFAALISATDPVAVVGLFKSLGVPKRLGVLVEGESLINDGTSIVIFSLVLAMVLGGNTSLSHAVFSFIKVVGGALLIGTLMGFAISKAIQNIDDPMIEITLTVIAAYGSFVAAEYFHFSGVIATVTAGMLCGNYATRSGMHPSTRIAVESFWEYLAFALNSLVFLLIGFQVNLTNLLASWKVIILAFFIVLIARSLVIFLASAFLQKTREKYPWSWSAILTWGGLRGGLSMVLVMGLPQNFPHREFLITLTFGVVILSILLQGLTMKGLLQKLKLITLSKEQFQYEIQRGSLRATTSALEELKRMNMEKIFHGEVLTQLKKEYENKSKKAHQDLQDIHLSQKELQQEERLEAKRHLLQVEKESLLRSLRSGYIQKEAFEELTDALDQQLISLEENH